LLHTRPTAVNLAWAIQRMRRVYREHRGAPMNRLRERLEREAQAIHDEDIASNRQLGRHGAALLPDEGTVLTYCNAGALATAGYGTALGIIRRAREVGKRISVVACETRPYLQGARLTAWELLRDRIPCTLVTDNMVGHLMQQGAIDAVIVGTDRTVANGDVANKIGTYTIAVLARRHGVPFYVAAPLSSVDLRMRCGAEIPIEERSPEELTQIGGTSLAPRGVRVFHPAFDVTPSRLITAIVTERGVVRPPYRKNLARLVRDAARTGRERERR
jgi:methylthioribose-1-phosphate isomerase